MIVCEHPSCHALFPLIEVRADGRRKADVVRMGIWPLHVDSQLTQCLANLQASQRPDDLRRFGLIVATPAGDVRTMSPQSLPQRVVKAFRGLWVQVQKRREGAG